MNNCGFEETLIQCRHEIKRPLRKRDVLKAEIFLRCRQVLNSITAINIGARHWHMRQYSCGIEEKESGRNILCTQARKEALDGCRRQGIAFASQITSFIPTCALEFQRRPWWMSRHLRWRNIILGHVGSRHIKMQAVSVQYTQPKLRVVSRKNEFQCSDVSLRAMPKVNRGTLLVMNKRCLSISDF